MAKRHSDQSKITSTSNKSSSYLVWGVSILVLGLLAFGMMQVLGLDTPQSGEQVSLQSEGESLQSTGLEAGAAQDSSPDGTEVVADRETRYLGPASDPASLSLAEVGDLGQPTLVWFHADWCHVCQQIKPEVVDLGEAYEGQVKIVRLNIDYAENRAAVQRYSVRATPTFVLFDTHGQTRGQVPGWPGYGTFTNAFEELLAEG